MMRKLQIVAGVTKFMIQPTISVHKIKNFPRYFQVYLNLHTKRYEHIRNSLSQYNKQYAKKQQTNKLKSQMESIKQSALQRIQQLKKKDVKSIKDIKQSNIEQTLKIYVNKGFQYLGLYYQSLQSLVQGKREVLHNEKFKFQDGQTVKQKQRNAQKVLRNLMGMKEKQKQNNK